MEVTELASMRTSWTLDSQNLCKCQVGGLRQLVKRNISAQKTETGNPQGKLASKTNCIANSRFN